MKTISRNKTTLLDEILNEYDFGCFSISSNDPNQDNYIFSSFKNKFLLAVADGIGGLPFGTKASQAAIDCLAEINLDGNISKDDVLNTFPKIRSRLEKIKKYYNIESEIGTTLTVAFIDDEFINIFHTGDSRLFLFKEKDIFFQTTDQTLSSQYGIKDHANIITSAIISNRELKIKNNIVKRDSIESLILVTDGVYKSLENDQFKYLCKICESSNLLSETIKSYLEIKGVDDDSTMMSFSIRNYNG
ncbi:PP2C family protein-serine/threonine phosphatase [Pelobacter seleniigenes]|uniref:PP2C family protein-serine/threonine phosphatase n=1 Tax=Pelobacter seleniigenes TaxID=407188 RepID=UPI0004A72117|nr:protein phosphatase 2C domain-containing protein [Pelobacter seleniigenes]